MEQLEWHTEQRRIRDLVPTERNPRKLSENDRRRLEEKIRKLGVFEIPTIDHTGQLLNFNQRLKVLLALGRGDSTIDVRVPNRPLTDSERKEIILSSNIHEGEWDSEILNADYSGLDMAALGMDDDIMAGLEEELAEQEPPTAEPAPELPITAKFSEKYTAFVIVARNEIDANYLAEAFGLDQEKCYKSSAIGTSHVIRAEKFIELWNRLKS